MDLRFASAKWGGTRMGMGLWFLFENGNVNAYPALARVWDGNEIGVPHPKLALLPFLAKD